MKLNGWHRIGLLISVIWILIGTFTYFNQMRHDQLFLKGLVPSAAYEWVWTKDIEHVGEKNEVEVLVSSFNLLGFLSFIFVPIALGWIIVYLFLFIIRWVINGFNLR